MTTSSPPHPAFTLAGQHPTDRILSAQALTSATVLAGDAPPTRNQVAAVLRALADRTHNLHMTSPAVRSLADDEPAGADRDATALGRYFHALADDLTGSRTR